MSSVACVISVNCHKGKLRQVEHTCCRDNCLKVQTLLRVEYMFLKLRKCSFLFK